MLQLARSLAVFPGTPGDTQELGTCIFYKKRKKKKNLPTTHCQHYWARPDRFKAPIKLYFYICISLRILFTSCTPPQDNRSQEEIFAKRGIPLFAITKNLLHYHPVAFFKRRFNPLLVPRSKPLQAISMKQG